MRGVGMDWAILAVMMPRSINSNCQHRKKSRRCFISNRASAQCGTIAGLRTLPASKKLVRISGGLSVQMIEGLTHLLKRSCVCKVFERSFKYFKNWRLIMTVILTGGFFYSFANRCIR